MSGFAKHIPLSLMIYSDQLTGEQNLQNLGSKIGVEHDNNHDPADGDDDTFQESWAFSWYDPSSRIGGWQHLGMQRPRGISDVNSYVSQDGAICGRYETLSLPMPDGDFSNLTVGPISIKSQRPLTKHRIIIDHGVATAELEMDAFIGPYGMGHADADSHWESFGLVQGAAEINGHRIAVSGVAFQDRSWGPRNLSGLLGWNLMTAIFGEDLVFRLFQSTRTAGKIDYGFIYDKGVFHELKTIYCDVAVTAGGTRLHGVDATIWTKSGRGYHLKGTSVDCDLIRNRDDRASLHSNAVYECGGRVGTGFIDCRLLPQIPVGHG